MFSNFSRKIAILLGHPIAFWTASLTIILWALSGSFFGFSDTWQLIINTATTIITFLMVFIIQNTQNHDTLAIHLKLDELIRSLQGAHNLLLDIENLTDEELEQLHKRYETLAKEIQKKMKLGEKDQGTPEVIQ